MSSYSVNLEEIRRDKGIVYRLDFGVNGKRIRQTVGSNKKTAELIRADTIQKLILGTYKPTGEKAHNLNIQELIAEFLRSIKNNVRPQSLARYQTYLSRFSDFFRVYFPAVFADVRMIREKYKREFIDKTINDDSQTANRWSPRTMNSAMTPLKHCSGLLWMMVIFWLQILCN